MESKNIQNEAGNYKDVSNKFKNALDVLPEKYFNRKGVLSLIKKLKEKNPAAAMAYTMDAFGWMSGMKETTVNEAAPKMKVEKWHTELNQATQSILKAERMLKLEQPGTHGRAKKSFLKTIKALQSLKSDTRR